MDPVLIYLQDISNKVPSPLKNIISDIQVDFDRKLWHPIAVRLLQFFEDTSSKPFLIDIFDKVVLKVEKKISPFAFSRLAVLTAQTIKGKLDYPQGKHLYQPPIFCLDHGAAVNFLNPLIEKVKNDPGAYSYLLTETAYFMLLKDDIVGVESILEKSQNLLEGVVGLDYKIHASQYRIAAFLNKRQANYSSYYKNALLYLSVIPQEEDLSMQEKYHWAHDIAVAALLGDSIYNFGELITNPILEVLQESPSAWYRSLLLAFQTGNMAAYVSIEKEHESDPFIQKHSAFLKEKQCLMSLVESVFQHGIDDRTISFKEISELTTLPINEVEFLIMKAMALDLIRGKIDEVSQCLIATWVQPRVLNLNQVKLLHARMSAWQAKVSSLASTVLSETTDWLSV